MQKRQFFIWPAFIVLWQIISVNATAQVLYNNGDLVTVQDGALLFIGGTFINKQTTAGLSSNGKVYLTGDFVSEQNNLLVMDSILFTGSTPQVYTNSGPVLTVNNFTIQNSSSGITLQNHLAISSTGKTDFLGGKITTAASHLLIYKAGAVPGSPSNNSCVNGPVRWLGTGSFTYPTGNSFFYRPVDVHLLSNASGLDVYYHAGKSPTGIMLAPLQRASQMEYWNITAFSTASGSVTLNWDESNVPAGIITAGGVNDVRVAALLSGVWTNMSGSIGGIGSPYAGNVTTNGAVNQWGDYALGSVDVVNAPLPVQKFNLNSKVVSNSNATELSWALELADISELDHYVLESSADGRGFAAAGIFYVTRFLLADANTSTTKYYRVKAILKNGTYLISNTIAITAAGNTKISLVRRSSPAEDVRVWFGTNTNGKYSVTVINTAGQIVAKRNLYINGNEVASVCNGSSLLPGIYSIRIISDKGTEISEIFLNY